MGLAQIAKLDRFLTLQRKNHAILKEELASIPGISFRRIPDPSGDSCTFLSWFLPTESLTRAAISEMKAAGILAGNFYWFDNNWHYIRKWDHLKEANTLSRLHPEHRAAVIKSATAPFPASDAIMSKCISTLISLLWSEDQIREKGRAMKAAVMSAMKKEQLGA